MQIEIPTELYERLRQRSPDPAKAIREALDSLEYRDVELAAVRAGLDAADAGRSKSLEQFDRDFRAQNGLA